MKTFLLLATALTLVLAQDSASCQAALDIQVEAIEEAKKKDLVSDPTCAASAVQIGKYYESQWGISASCFVAFESASTCDEYLVAYADFCARIDKCSGDCRPYTPPGSAVRPCGDTPNDEDSADNKDNDDSAAGRTAGSSAQQDDSAAGRTAGSSAQQLAAAATLAALLVSRRL